MTEIRITLDILIEAVLRQHQHPHCAKDTFPRKKKEKKKTHKDCHCSAFMWRTGPTSLFKVTLQPLVSALTDLQSVWPQMNGKPARVKVGAVPKPPCTRQQKVYCCRKWKQFEKWLCWHGWCLGISFTCQQLWESCFCLADMPADLRKIKLNLFNCLLTA